MLIENDTHSSYTPKELSVLDLLKHPVWVFDIERKCMFWANKSALEVWNAESLDALLQRDFSSDMSEAAEARMRDNLATISRGGTLKEQWTFYPRGMGAKTVSLTATGIRIDGGRIAALVETELPDKEAFKDDTVRGMEMLRNLPLAISQFSLKGQLIYQNPEAVCVFGSHENKNSNDTDGAVTVYDATDPIYDFHNQFVDKNFGKTALKQVQEGTDFNAEAQHHTTLGSRWFSTSLRRTRDPVTSEFVILQSARDISEIIEARQETSRAALKSEFMAVMAHEIRTPLHQMIGYLDILESSKLVPDQNSYVKQIQSSSSMLMSIINDLLDYSKLECGQVQVENVEFGLQGLIDGLLACVQPGADQKLLSLQCTLAENVPRKLMGDPNRIRQILLNLLSNSIKFTDNEGAVAVNVTLARADENQQRIRFEVTDNGIGIHPSVQHVIFEKYRQADPSISRQYGGTGLGLAICKGLTDLMGGFFGCKSELDKGTTMFFEVPFHLPSRRTTQPVDQKHIVTGMSETSSKLRILVVEDNKINQKMMHRMLEKLGHFVALADNGQVAVELIEQESFDLVLMDVQMPVMDGIECTKHIRKKLSIDKDTLPVVGLTASFQKEELQFYKDIGMNNCLGKPLRLEQLKQAISAKT